MILLGILVVVLALYCISSDEDFAALVLVVAYATAFFSMAA